MPQHTPAEKAKLRKAGLTRTKKKARAKKKGGSAHRRGR